MNKIGLWVLILVVAVGALVVVVQRDSTVQDSSKFTVVTTFHPLTQLTTPLAGDDAAVEQLVGSGQEVHEYQVKPSDLELLKSADLLILNGADLEHEWLEPLIESSGRDDLLILDMSGVLTDRGVQLLKAEEHHDEENPTSPDGLRVTQPELGTDPHIWLSLRNAAIMVEAIRDALVAQDSKHAAGYERRSTQFLLELAALDQEIQTRVAGFSQTEFIGFHSAFSYFARDYGLQQVASIELTPGEAPTPGQLAEIGTLVREHKLRALFSEPQFSSTLVEQLASDLGIEVLVLDPLETGDADETYVEGMRRNLVNLEQGLR